MTSDSLIEKLQDRMMYFPSDIREEILAIAHQHEAEIVEQLRSLPTYGTITGTVNGTMICLEEALAALGSCCGRAQDDKGEVKQDIMGDASTRKDEERELESRTLVNLPERPSPASDDHTIVHHEPRDGNCPSVFSSGDSETPVCPHCKSTDVESCDIVYYCKQCGAGGGHNSPSEMRYIKGDQNEIATQLAMEMVESRGSSHAAVFPVIDYTLSRLTELGYLRTPEPVSLARCVKAMDAVAKEDGFRQTIIYDPEQFAKAVLDAAGVEYHED